jgi:putative membrane protein
MRRWALPGVLALLQVGYPLVAAETRATLVVVIVVVGFAAVVNHALTTQGGLQTAALLAITTGGGFAVEAIGVATGVPFGRYAYSDALGPRLLGVPLVIPLAWTWMAWPAWLAAGRMVGRRPARVAVGAVGLAAWDLFLDPQMVAEGYWRWSDPTPALPGVPGVPITNYLGWLAVAAVMMAVLSRARLREPADDAPMLALYLWTYASSVVAHALFLDLPGSAAWGALGMGVVALPLARRARTWF